jgi:hypothetical protein
MADKRRYWEQAQGIAYEDNFIQRLDQNGKWSGMGARRTQRPHSPIADAAPPAERSDLTHTGIHAERGKPDVLPHG